MNDSSLLSVENAAGHIPALRYMVESKQEKFTVAENSAQTWICKDVRESILFMRINFGLILES